jgi:uncharacterized protein YrrD
LEKYSEVVGLPVICADSGKRIGIIKDVIFCPARKEVIGFLLEHKGLEVNKKLILPENMVHISRDAAVITSSSCITSMKKLEADRTLKDRGVIKGLSIFSKTGEELGVAEDILFDYKTGYIEGIEVSDGLIQDVVQGRRILPLLGKVEFSEENILVDREAIEEMTHSGGGIRHRLFGESK